MKITTLVLILFIAIMVFFLVMRYFRLKRDAKDSVGLADAYRSGILILILQLSTSKLKAPLPPKIKTFWQP